MIWKHPTDRLCFFDGRHPSRFQATRRDQLCLLETFRGKVDSRVSSDGLTAADVQMFVDEIKKHPDVSVALLDAVRVEVATLMQGQRFSFDFD